MKRIANYLKQYFWHYIIAISAMVIAIALDMFNPYLIKRIIDDVFIGGNNTIFTGALAALGIITVSRAVLGYIKEYAFDLSASEIILKIRKDLFAHIQTLSFSYFDENNTGELMSRIKEDTENIFHALSFGIMLLLEQSIYFIVGTAVLIYINWKLTLISLITMPVIAFLAIKLEKEIGITYEKLSDQRVKLNTTAQENIAGVRLVKAFGREKYEIKKFLKKNRKNYDLCLEQACVWSNYHPKIEFLANVVIVLVTSVGGYLVIGENMSIGTLVAFSNYIYMLIWPMRMIGWIANVLAQCAASIHKVEKLFNDQPAVNNPDNPVKPTDFKGEVIFKDVGFEYNGSMVLKNINIKANPGSTIAIMGMTGSGKSTLINLIGRYYDCSCGEILIDGVNTKDMDLECLRSQISLVMQDTFLFSDTIEENIKFGKADASNDELLNCAKDARVNEFVMKMPDAYETVIGERGIGLSGGQRQRISIARALTKPCKILILDDATSALDMETEYQIQKALQNRAGMTKFIIAHRISSVMNADEIIILEDGKIVERGTHANLLSKKGRYYEIFNEQFPKTNFLIEEVV